MNSKTKHTARDLAIGAAITALVWAVTIDLIPLLTYIGLGEPASTGQLALDFLMVPVTVFGIIIALREFRNSQKGPDLALRWALSKPGLEQQREMRFRDFDYAEQLSTSIRLQPMITNSGPVATDSYEVHLHVPPALFSIRPRDMPGWIKPISGKLSTNWLLKLEPAHGPLSAPSGLVIFRSLGQYTVFPNSPFPLPLADLYLNPPHLIEHRKHEFAYTIISDKSEPVTGHLTLIILP